MELDEAIEKAVRLRNHPRYRVLCDESHADHEYWRREVFRIAGHPVKEPAPQPDLPPVRVQATNLIETVAKSVSRAARGETVTVSDAAAQERLAICGACPSLREDKRCAECGCFMVAAVHVAAKECPLGKWPSLGG